ncbi:MAG: hypothetical protein RRZ24_04580, partial [Clostridia bacterium]
MQIVRRASAGTLESSDAYIEIEPIDAGLQLEIESVVYQQFGNQIQSNATE